MKELWRLYWAFFRVGAFTFGGGYAMMPLIQKEIVERYHWATAEEIMDYYALGQCTPGVIAVNTATFVGYKKAKIAGGVVATLGVISPSIIIITFVAKILGCFAGEPVVAHAFVGIRIAVVALVLNTIIKMWKTSVKDTLGVVLFLVAFLVVAVFGFSAVWVTILGIAVGIGAGILREKQKEEDRS